MEEIMKKIMRIISIFIFYTVPYAGFIYLAIFSVAKLLVMVNIGPAEQASYILGYFWKSYLFFSVMTFLVSGKNMIKLIRLFLIISLKKIFLRERSLLISLMFTFIQGSKKTVIKYSSFLTAELIQFRRRLAIRAKESLLIAGQGWKCRNASLITPSDQVNAGFI